MLLFIKGHARNTVNTYKLKDLKTTDTWHNSVSTTLKLPAALVWLNKCITEVNSLWVVCDIWKHWSKKKMETKSQEKGEFGEPFYLGQYHETVLC